MAGAEIEELESYHEAILKKYEFSGISSLSPSEVCLTLISPSWEYNFFKTTKTHWLKVVGSYRSTLLSHLKSSSDDQQKKKDLENSCLRQQAGRSFLELLDNISISHEGNISDPSLKDDYILERLKDSLVKCNISLMNLLLKNDFNHDGFINKSELVSGLEEIKMAPQDIVALLRIAGYRSGVDRIPIAGFSDLISKRGDDRKKEEYALFTKVLNAFNSKDKNLSKVFAYLDANKDGSITEDELRKGLNTMNISLNIAECKKVFAILDKDRSGSISLDELKKRLATLGTGGHEIKDDASHISGDLEVAIIKGEKFKAGLKTVKVKFGTTEYTSTAVNDANPEWKFTSKFEVRNLALINVPRDIEIEVFSGKKSEGKAVITLSDVRNTEKLKSKLDIAVNKQSHGKVQVISTWKEVKVESNSDIGHLALWIVRGEGINSSIEFSSENKTVVIPEKALGQTFRLEKLKKHSKMVLKIQKMGNDTFKELMLQDVISEERRTPYEIEIDKTKIYVQILWEEFDEEDEKEDRAATKIQAVWRGYLARHHSRIRNARKLILKKSTTYEKNRYILAIYSNDKNIEIEVHPADSCQVGTDTILSINTFPLQEPSELLPNLVLLPDLTLGSVLNKKSLRGDLEIQVLQTKGFPRNILHMTIGNQSVALANGTSEPAFFGNLTFKNIPNEIQCKVLESSNKQVLGECQIYWLHALLKHGEWSCNTIVPVGQNGSLLIKVKWSPLPDILNEEQAAILIQKNWRAKMQRDELKILQRKSLLIGRKGLTKNNKIYLISVLQDGDNWIVALHPADNQQVASYETIDKLTLDNHGTIEEVLSKITVEDDKIKLI